MPIESKESPEFQALVRKVVLKTFGQERHTQDSPILPDVWIEYARKPPGERVDLIITPKVDVQPGSVARFLRQQLDDMGVDPGRQARVAATRNSLSARLTLQELLLLLAPMTVWWADVTEKLQATADKPVSCAQAGPSGGRCVKFSGQAFGQAFDQMTRMIREDEQVSEVISMKGLWDFFRFAALAGFVSLTQERPEGELAAVESDAERLSNANSRIREFEAIVDWFLRYGSEIRPRMDTVAGAQMQNSVWLVSPNRPAQGSVAASRQTIKADAAQNLFNIATKGITWAVVDSGIDARHPAFLDREVQPDAEPDADIDIEKSRVVRTYDFTLLRGLLSTGDLWDDTSNQPPPEWVRKNRDDHADLLTKLRNRIHDGDEIDWDLIEPLIRIPHDNDLYVAPQSEHGTHVAGIIGGFWKKDEGPEEVDLTGMAPDIRLFDVRVFGGDGGGYEDTILSALQFLLHLNRRRDLPVVHGVNLSLSLVHQVQSFACGQTPICQECNRLGNNGLLIVAAAGNRGIEDGTGSGAVFEAYRDISITDPGNAEGVITVGSTHRSEPHTYGVSYFSSRGPSGDGRRKPDLVAPGEKILGPIPRRGVRRMDGTSMAAPHVSGAAALLMARHRELIGQPRTIKEILCRTATDLGRERYFQGTGLVDILRALQSV